MLERLSGNKLVFFGNSLHHLVISWRILSKTGGKVFDVGNLKFRARGSYYLVSDRYAMLFICHYFSSSPLICSRRYFALRVCFDHSDRKKGHPDTLQPMERRSWSRRTGNRKKGRLWLEATQDWFSKVCFLWSLHRLSCRVEIIHLWVGIRQE
jgi:hypothetical protein